MRRAARLALLLALLPAPALADGGEVTITLHDATMPTGTMGIVSERRSVELTAGAGEVRLGGLPPLLEGSLLLLDETDAAARVRELSVEPAVSSSLAAFFATRRGQQLAVSTVNGEESGELVAWGEDVLLRRADGTLAILAPAHIVSVRLPKTDQTLDTATLVARVETGRAGPHQLRLLYRTPALGWHASYSAVIAEDGTLDIQGWVTVGNSSNVGWKDAELRLVTTPPAPSGRGYSEYDEYRPPQPQVVPEPRTVVLDGRHAVAAGVSRQIAILGAHLQPKSRVVVFEHTPAPQGYFEPGQTIMDQYPEGSLPQTRSDLDVFVELANTRAAGLGAPLPPGRLQLYRRAGGRLEDAGEDVVPLVATGDSFRVRLAKIADVSVERRQRDFQLDEQAREMREEMELVFKNKRREAVEVVAVEHMYRSPTWVVEAESAPSKRSPENATASFRVRVPAGGTQTLTYTVLYTW